MLVRKQTPNLLQIFCKLLLYSQVIFKSMRVPDDTFWRKSKCEWVKGEPQRRGNSRKPILIPAYLPQAKIFISIRFYRNTSAAPVCGYWGWDDGSLTVAAAAAAGGDHTQNTCKHSDNYCHLLGNTGTKMQKCTTAGINVSPNQE